MGQTMALVALDGAGPNPVGEARAASIAYSLIAKSERRRAQRRRG
jgi:hypothetical protein